MYQLDPVDSNDHGPCECCGSMSRMVTGFILDEQGGVAGFAVNWTLGQVPRHGAEFHFILGEWGDEARKEDRFGVAMHFFAAGAHSGYTLVDAAETPLANHPLVGKTKSREEVIGTPLAEKVFEFVDFLCVADGRLEEIVSEFTRPCPTDEEETEDEQEPEPSTMHAWQVLCWVGVVVVLVVGTFQLLDLLQANVGERPFRIGFLTVMVLSLWYLMHRYIARRRAKRGWKLPN